MIKNLSIETPEQRQLLLASFKKALRSARKQWKKRVGLGLRTKTKGRVEEDNHAGSLISMRDVLPGPGISLKN